MRLIRSPYFGTGICPMCRKSTKANVHQRCGIARERQHLARRAKSKRSSDGRCTSKVRMT